MAEIQNVLICAATGLAIYTLLGWAVVVWMASPSLPGLSAPLLGWALYNAVALPLFAVAGMSRPIVLMITGPLVVIAAIVSKPWRHRSLTVSQSMLLVGLMVLALIPAMAVLPKASAEGISLASPIFDHSKIALIDEMIRSGVPSSNPFFGEIGTSDRITYYYLWHFSAATLAVIAGVSGWEADAALTWVSAFATLLVMVGLAMRLSGGRLFAGWLVLAFAVTGSLRTTLEWVAPQTIPSLIGSASGFGGWMFQTSWAPHHVTSAACVVLIVLMISELKDRGGRRVAVVLGLLSAAAFQSSIWVGGITLSLVVFTIVAPLLHSLPREQRRVVFFRGLLATSIAALLSLRFIFDQVAASGLRSGGLPIAVRPVEVAGSAIPENFRAIVDLPSFWLVYLPVEFVFYLPGLLGLVWLVGLRSPHPCGRIGVRPLAMLTGVSLCVAWLLASVIGDNNDLGWRAVLPGAMMLIVFASALIAQWPDRSALIAGVLAATGMLLALPESLGVVRENLLGVRKPSERAFRATPELWQAVRRHAAPTERIANNPLLLADMTPWPVNISWALMANRRSCYAGNELALPFAPIPAHRRAAIEAQFVRVFAGFPMDGDIETMASRFRCDVVVVTPQDGAWQRDPFQIEGPYRLVENQSGWRIYRRAALASAKQARLH